MYGQSWGGVLAIEYALRFQEHLAGLIVSNMMASIPAYNQYAQNVLMPGMDQAALEEIKRLETGGEFEKPRYMERLIPQHYIHHVLRGPHDRWPDPVNRAFKHLNPAIYVPMQGPSELGASGKLLNWDCTSDLAMIRCAPRGPVEFQLSFPLRDLVLGVVAATLIVQGLTLEPVCKRVLGSTHGSDRR